MLSVPAWTAALPAALQQSINSCNAALIECVLHAIRPMIFDCIALESESYEHLSVFEKDGLSLADFMGQDPTKVAAVLYDCFKACEKKIAFGYWNL